MALSSSANPPRLGRYRIVRRIAEGGMAELYCARASAASDGHPGFEREVAIKRILPHLARDPDFVRMFLNEARLAATFRHPNVVSVFEVGVEEDEHFIVMELLEGADVARLLRAQSGRPLPLEHALQIALGAAAALHYAHQLRDAAGAPLEIVHRDISPHNLFVTGDGAVKVLDFGIAKAAGQLAQTGQSTLKGKARYMSPEQCAGEPIDRRSDLFSLSIVMWEMSTGRKLFGGEGDYKIMKAIAETDAPRPSTVVPDYPVELERIVMKGLARRPADRYATAEELQLALEGYLRSAAILPSTLRLSQYVRALVPEGRTFLPQLVADASPVETDASVTTPDGPRGGHTRAIARKVPTAAAVQADAHPSKPGRRGSRRAGLLLLGSLAAALAVTATVRSRSDGNPAAAPPPPSPASPTPPERAETPVVATTPAAVIAPPPVTRVDPPRAHGPRAAHEQPKARSRHPKDRPKTQPAWDEFSPRLPP